MCSLSQIDASWLPPMRILPEQLHESRVEGSCYVVLEVTGVLGSTTCALSPVWDAQWQCHALHASLSDVAPHGKVQQLALHAYVLGLKTEC